MAADARRTGAGAGPDKSRTRISICVATCRRPASLAALLGALDALDVPDGFRAEIVVVDNDPNETARPVCDAHRMHAVLPLHYATEARRGIAFARNAALRVALPGSEYVAFLDDDTTPESDWLVRLLHARARFAADVVTGPAPPRYQQTPAAWVVDGGFFERPRYATGTERPVAYTHNALVRSRVFAALERHFEESLVLSGGEDSEFFGRVRTAGFRIVWADDAVVHESIPPARATLRWIAMRGFSVGTSSGWIDSRSAAQTRARILVHAAYCIAKGLALVVLLPCLGRARAAEGLRLACYGAGRLAGHAGYLHQEYQLHPDPRDPPQRAHAD